MRHHRHILTITAALALFAFGVGTAAAGEGGDPGPAPAPPAATIAKGASGPSTLAAASLAPANDNFDEAQVLPGPNNSITGSNVGTTTEPGEPSHGDPTHGASNSVWYSWTAPTTGPVVFRTVGSNFDTVMAEYTEGNGGLFGLTEVANSDDITTSVTSQIRFAATKGHRYVIAVDGFNLATGAIKLSWTTNDDFATAPALPGPVEGGFATFAVHNEGSTAESGEPQHAGKSGSTSVWYNWTAPFSGNATFQTTQNNYDTILAVYTGDKVNQLTEVASNDDQPGNHRSKVLFTAKAGQTYRIALAGFNSQSGFEVVNYTLARRQIIAGDATVTEGAAGSTKVVNLPVTLTTPNPSAVKVHFATADGTAKAGSDYIATSGDLTFAAGQTSKSVPVTIMGDAIKEAPESFSLQLSGASSGYTFKDATGTGTISNDD